MIRLTIINLVTLCSVSIASPEVSPHDFVTEQLRWFMDSWKSIEFEVTTTFKFGNMGAGAKNAVDPNKLYDHTSEHFIATQDGKIKKVFASHTNGGHVSGAEHYSDGVNYAVVGFSPQNASKQRKIETGKLSSLGVMSERFSWPAPFNLLFVKGVPLYEALSKAKFVGRAVSENVACFAFTFAEVDSGFIGQTVTYYFAVDSGRIVRVDAFKADLPSWTWKPLKVMKLQGLDIPVVSSRECYDVSPVSHPHVIRFETKHTVSDFKLDRIYAISTFRPNAQPGVIINDRSRHVVTREPGRPDAKIKSTVAAIKVPNPDHADDKFLTADDRSAFPLVIGSTVLVLGCLAVGIMYLYKIKKLL